MLGMALLSVGYNAFEFFLQDRSTCEQQRGVAQQRTVRCSRPLAASAVCCVADHRARSVAASIDRHAAVRAAGCCLYSRMKAHASVIAKAAFAGRAVCNHQLPSIEPPQSLAAPMQNDHSLSRWPRHCTTLRVAASSLIRPRTWLVVVQKDHFLSRSCQLVEVGGGGLGATLQGLWCGVWVQSAECRSGSRCKTGA